MTIEASLFTSDCEIWQLIDLSSDGAILSNSCLYLFICLYDLKVLSDKVMSGQSADQVPLFLKAVNHYLKHILLPVTLLESAEEKEWSYGFFSTKECAGCGGRWCVLLQQFIVDGLTTDRANAPGHFCIRSCRTSQVPSC